MAADSKTPLSVQEAIRACLKDSKACLVVELPGSETITFPLGIADQEWATGFVESHPLTTQAAKDQWCERASKKQSVEEVKELLTKRGLTLADLSAELATEFLAKPSEPGGAKRALESLVASQRGVCPKPKRSTPRSDARTRAQTA